MYTSVIFLVELCNHLHSLKFYNIITSEALYLLAVTLYTPFWSHPQL